jgi:opacity protein-like surface antigen
LIGLSVTYDSLVQVRARLGFVMGDAMPYVALGAAQSDIGIPGSPSGSETGLAYGIGVDLKLGSNMSLRAEYGGASFDDTLQHLGAPPGFDAKYEALTLGLAWHF